MPHYKQGLQLPYEDFFSIWADEHNGDILAFGQDERDVAYKYITNYNFAIDIGAHVGIASLDFAKRFDKVVAFEPNQEAYDCCIYNTKHLENVTVHPIGLLESPGIENAMYNKTKNSGSFTIPSRTWKPTRKYKDAKIQIVKTQKLDTYKFKDVGYIKVDVEGREFDTIKGAEETLKRCNPVLQIEESFQFENQRKIIWNYDVDEYKAFLKELGYVKVDRINDDSIYIKS